MKIVALACNIILIGFTSLVMLTDGAPKENAYIVFGLLLILVPILNAALISRIGLKGGWSSPHLKQKAPDEPERISINPSLRIGAAIWNVVLLGFACWAMIDQYPHPEEPGLFEFELLVILTPILSALVIAPRGAGKGLLSYHRAG